MKAEPYKIKEVKKMVRHEPYELWNVLKEAHFNTFRVSSDYVTFDMVARGMSAWSHFQKAAFMIGDEAYAGSRNFKKLQRVAADVLGIERLVPTHNGIGARKLLTTTMVSQGKIVLHNSGRPWPLVAENGGECMDVTSERAGNYGHPSEFGGGMDIDRLADTLASHREGEVAFVAVELCPDLWNAQPVSMTNLLEIREVTARHEVPLVLDLSNVLENAYWIHRHEATDVPIADLIKRIVSIGDVVMMDGSQDCRSDVGGFVSSRHSDLFEKLMNQVVVFEGLHTYGGMTGRAMEVFAVGISEMARSDYVEWHMSQVAALHEMLQADGVPARIGGKGVALDVRAFLPHLQPEDNPKFVLAASLFIQGGIRCPLDGLWCHQLGREGKVLFLEIPRHALTRDHLREIADEIATVYSKRDEIAGLRLVNRPVFVDEAEFEPENNRLFVEFPRRERSRERKFEPYKIAIFEPLERTTREHRRKVMAEAGYNTFLLDSEDVYIDFLTDSGTSAMSCFQWEGMTNSMDTPYSSRHHQELVEAFRDILGYEFIIPTHQGRAAEHIMSQTMIKPGQVVPGNMYFTTTKLHQELAGGVFVDVIVDEAHDPANPYPWKGNISLEKLQAEIDRVGAENVAYISFEMSVNMAGGQPFSMANVKEVSRLCQKHGIPVMFDATRCVENAYMIQRKEPGYRHRSIREILREMMSYGDGCTISCKKDFLVNMGGILACNNEELARKFEAMLRKWEGDVTNGGLDTKDIVALHRGLLDSIEDEYIKTRVEQTQYFGQRLIDAGVPIVMPAGTHAIFLDAKRFLPHIDQDEYPAQALAAAIYIETGVRTMERGNVSKGRDPKTGKNYRPALELVRCTIPRRVYTNSHIDYVVDGIAELYRKRDRITGLKFAYEPKVLRFFQGRFEPLKPWDL